MNKEQVTLICILLGAITICVSILALVAALVMGMISTIKSEETEEDEK